MGFVLTGTLHAQPYQIDYDETPVEGRTITVTVTKANSSAPDEVIVNLLPGSALPLISGLQFYDYTVDKKFSQVVVFDFVGDKKTFNIPIYNDNQQEDDEDFTVRVTDAVKGALLGELTLVIPANDAGGSLESLPGENRVPVPSLESPFGEIRIETENPPPVSRGWRFVGETEWRPFETSASQLLIEKPDGINPLPHEIEFLPIPGFSIKNRGGSSSNPLGAQFTFEEAGERQTFLIDYVANSADQGALTVEIFPTAEAKGNPPARWRIRHLDKDNNQEDDPYLTGDTLVLRAGFYEVYFDELPGFEVPRPRVVQVIENQENVIEATYLKSTAAGDSGKLPLTPIDYFEPPLPLRGVQGTGQVRSNIAKATGVAVAERVVLTTAQVIFNPKRLTTSYKVRWSLQRQTTGLDSNKSYNPPAQIPRGWYLFNDYSSALESLIPGDVSESSLDNSVAALFFTQPCAKGGFTGYLGSATNQKLPYLLDKNIGKFFAGYGLSQVTLPVLQSGTDGILYVSPGNYSAALNRISTTSSLYAAPGLSNQSEVPLGSLAGSALFLRGASVDIPGAILVGTRDVGKGEELIFRAIDVSLAALIHRASYSALTGNIYDTSGPAAGGDSLQTQDALGPMMISASGGLGGGFGGTGGGTFGSEATTGSLVINLAPSDAVTEGARWGQRSGGDANLESGAQVDGLIAGEYSNLIYSDAAGYEAPSDTAYTIVSEQTTRDQKSYTALTEEDLWMQSKFSADDLNDPDVVGPEANPDGDPYKNAVERALGGNPMASEDLINLSTSSGGLSIRIEPDTSQTDMILSIYVGSNPSAASGKGTIGARTDTGMKSWVTEGEGISIKDNGDGSYTIQDGNPGNSRFMYIEATSANP